MKLSGYELNRDELLELSEASIRASPNEVRCIADFLKAVADTMQQHGKEFGHEHFRDYAKRHGIELDDATADLVVFRVSEPTGM